MIKGTNQEHLPDSGIKYQYVYITYTDDPKSFWEDFFISIIIFLYIDW